jgi:hypothetical protein
MSEPGKFQYSTYPPSPLPPEKTMEKKHGKKTTRGWGVFFIFDTLSIRLIFGPPIDGVDCYCESAGQLVYGPHIGFLGHFDSLPV